MLLIIKLSCTFTTLCCRELGAEDNFKEISNAYKVLVDDEKRSIYDMYIYEEEGRKDQQMDYGKYKAGTKARPEAGTKAGTKARPEAGTKADRPKAETKDQEMDMMESRHSSSHLYIIIRA
ncbi:hypothetical protein TSUD_180760 [Trifolium subterraneum]|uniref:J domain-containing protein n=1 Tax=Trifolium subterraneum TaxID=3900 RepID=A0A2Z6NVN8_TRISU|nr:hypothetical protein TSUD_180760 [Trifolium subterraneum]